MNVHNLGTFDKDILVFGGPYSNLTATQTILAQAADAGIPSERVICTGDIVAYCAEPEATTQLIRDSGIHCLMGNCEESLAVGASDCGCGFDENSQCDVLSAQWYNFSLSNTSVESRQWMGSLPRALKFSMANLNFLVVHGSVSRINQFIFPSTPDSELVSQLALAKQEANADVVIGGHSGIPFGRSVSDGSWLNSGVIGMPANDGTGTGWYMRLRSSTKGVKVSWHRLIYDVEKASLSMLKGGLDNGYRNALTSGLWPSTDVLPDEDKRRSGQAIHLDPITLEVETL